MKQLLPCLFALAACSGGRAQGDASAPDPVSGSASAALSTVTPPASAALSGAPPSPCEGALVDLTVAFADARCVFDDEARADALRQDFETTTKPPFVVSASVLDDGRVEVRAQNPAATALVLPFFLSNAAPEDTFRVMAFAPGKKLFLRGARRAPVVGTARWRPRTFARVVVAPGGVAFVRLTIDPRVVESRIPLSCPPDAMCNPEILDRGPLPQGSWELSIALPILSLREASAKVPWQVK